MRDVSVPGIHARVDAVVGAFRQTFRSLRRAPAFTAAIIITLAIGIAANGTMAGALDALLFRAPSGIREPASLTRLFFSSVDAGTDVPPTSQSNYPALLALRAGVPDLEGIDGYSSLDIAYGEGRDAVIARATLVTGSFFETLGVRPAIGRALTPADGADGASRVAVIGDDFWRRQLGSAPVVGQLVRIGRYQYTIVGIAPPGFRGISTRAVDVWLPLGAGAADLDVTSEWRTDRGSFWLSIVGRMRPGVSRDAVERQASTVLRRWSAGSPDADTTLRVTAASMILGRSPDRPRDARTSMWLTAMSVLVLLIAVGNVVNLLVIRSIERQTETTVRLALGASPGTLARGQMLEVITLAVLGGALGMGLIVVGHAVVERALLSASAATGTSGGIVDARGAIITAAVTVVTALIIGLWSSLWIGAPRVSRLAMDPSHQTGQRVRARLALTTLQATLSIVLLVGAGLFALSLRHVQALDLGVDLDRTIVATIDVNRLALSRERSSELFAELLRRLRELPSVERAAVAASSPYMTGLAIGPYTDERSAESLWGDGRAVPFSTALGAEFFRTVGARSLRGRDFEESDVAAGEPVAIINVPLARYLWPNSDALGKCMRLDRPRRCARVVGVLAGVWKFSVFQRQRMEVFLPLGQQPSSTAPEAIFLRTRSKFSVAGPEIRRTIQSVRSDMPPVRLEELRDYADPEYRPWRLAAILFTAFGAIALLLSAVGVYGVVAFGVARRTRELAVRVALGARPADVVLAICRAEVAAVIIGLVLGIAVSIGASWWSSALLFETSSRDLRVISLAGAALLLVTLAAVVMPVKRALATDPVIGLRAD